MLHPHTPYYLSTISLLLLSLSPSTSATPLSTPHSLPPPPSSLTIRQSPSPLNTTLTILSTHILSLNLFSFALNSATSALTSPDYWRAVRRFINGITLDTQAAKVAGRVLKAGLVYYYGLLRMEMRWGFSMLPETCQGFLKGCFEVAADAVVLHAEAVEGLWSWDTVDAVARWVEEFVVRGVWGSVRMVLEVSAGVFLYVFFGIPIDDFLGRNDEVRVNVP
ncbi:MAG: hypothetical protein Q9192_005118 [Flavoplaca navasiana]